MSTLRTAAAKTMLVSAALITVVGWVQPTQAGNGTWTGGSSDNGNWSNTSNWSGGTPAGSTLVLNDSGVATFNAAIANTWGASAANPIVVDSPTQNVAGMTFTGGSVGNFFIGSTAGNSLFLTSGGSIILSSAASNNPTITVNAPLILRGSYTFRNSNASSASKLIIGGSVSSGVSGSVLLTLSSVSSGANEVSGIISNGSASTFSVNVDGGGGRFLLSGANSYNGPTQIANTSGTVTTAVEVSSINSVFTNETLGTVHSASSNLGAPTTVANGTINLAAGMLIYTGSGETTDRVINLGSNVAGKFATLDQSGTSGLLKFTSDFTATGAKANLLTLQGSTNGTGEIAGKVVDNSAVNKTSLVKRGIGQWTLSAANTYSGGTSVLAGRLMITSTGTLGAGSVVVDATGGTGSVLELNSATSIADTASLTLLNGGKINLMFGSGNTEGIAQLNLDGVIFNTSTTFSQANGFVVNGVDYSSYFAGSSAGTSLHVIPEPGSFALIGLALSVVLTRRCRTCRV